MHLRHHSHACAWRSLARPTRRPAAHAHASSRVAFPASPYARSLTSPTVSFASARDDRRARCSAWPVDALAGSDPRCGCAHGARQASACVHHGGKGGLRSVPADYCGAALLPNAAANFGNICIGALACRHAHAPAGATAATRRLLRAPPAPSASNSV
ncbi:hypothetical protein T492DRAFT_977538, partial [Pavlovales sp. CCMP2436]